MTNNSNIINRMDREEILNTLGEVRHELAKVKKKLDNLVSQSIRYKEIHPELDRPVLALQGISDDIYETIEIEKWVLMNSLN
ncbi:MAG: hypothetical protein C0430_09205 [Flavobacterium sp.]|nr:hypothetical protein [Flavobacterium sp.]